MDDEGTALDIVVQRRRNRKAALRLLRKLLKNQGIKPTRIVTDRLGSNGAALKLVGLNVFKTLGVARTTALNVHMFRYEDENENHRDLGPLKLYS